MNQMIIDYTLGNANCFPKWVFILDHDSWTTTTAGQTSEFVVHIFRKATWARSVYYATPPIGAWERYSDMLTFIPWNKHVKLQAKWEFLSSSYYHQVVSNQFRQFTPNNKFPELPLTQNYAWLWICILESIWDTLHPPTGKSLKI